MKHFFSFFLSSLILVGAAERPNIMIFLVDDMGIMDTSVPFLTDEAGAPKKYPLNEFYRTPAMERLAKQGIRLNQFYAMSVCSPTRISIMTGQNAARHGATNWINPSADNRGTHGPLNWNWKGLKKGEVTLPGVLAKEGYRTIHVGKAHFGPTEFEGSEPLNLGFEVNVGGAAFGAPGSYYGEKNYRRGGQRRPHAVPHLEQYHGTDTFLSEALTLEAKKEVKKSLDAKEPFFLHFAHYAVHSPFDSDPRFAAHYQDSGMDQRVQAFATLIEGIDQSLGEMLDYFEELGISENTLVIFLGDNGTDAPIGHQHEVACAAPLRGKKGAHYEGGMRVPFIAAWAKPSEKAEAQKKLPISQGVIQSQVGSVEDLFPSILAWTGAQAPKNHVIDGADLGTLLSGKKDASRENQFLMHYPHGPHRSNYFTTWRNGDWKVIFHALPKIKAKGGTIQNGGEKYELFNLKEDPFEKKNLAREKPAILKKMVKEMAAQLERHEAMYPTDSEGNELRPVIE